MCSGKQADSLNMIKTLHQKQLNVCFRLVLVCADHPQNRMWQDEIAHPAYSYIGPPGVCPPANIYRYGTQYRINERMARDAIARKKRQAIRARELRDQFAAREARMNPTARQGRSSYNPRGSQFSQSERPQRYQRPQSAPIHGRSRPQSSSSTRTYTHGDLHKQNAHIRQAW